MILSCMIYNMGPDLDLKGTASKEPEKSNMDVSPSKDGTAAKEPEKMACANNCEDNSFLMEPLPNEHTPNRSEDAEVNIADGIKYDERGHSEDESQDATENSSSFGDTDSGVRHGAMSNDVEVESELRDHITSGLAFGGVGDLFQKRKKKLTAHWRKFVSPLMWRCKWVELQIRELQTQALKYDRELAECDQRKHHDLQNLTLNDHGVKSTPISCQSRKVSIMMRKKRKRVEEATDVTSYMSRHNLFSFLVNKKPYADRLYIDDDFGNLVKPARNNFMSDEFGVNGGWPCLEFKDDNTLEEIFHKIDEAQFQLSMLKVRMDKVIGENAAKICSNVEVSTLCNVPTSSAAKALPHIKGKGLAGSLCITSRDRKDVGMPESAVSSYGEVASLPDVIESTDQPQVGLLCEKIEDKVSIKEDVGVQLVGKPRLTSAVKERNAVLPAPDAEPVSQSNKAVPPSQQGVKMRSVSKLGNPKNQRKRTRRKARTKTYSRRSSA